MNYKLLGLTAFIFISKGMCMQDESSSEPALSPELAEIPADQRAIYQEFYTNKRNILTAVYTKLLADYSDMNIPAKRQRKLDKALACYKEQSTALLYKSLGSFLVASGAGYYTVRGCQTPEATVLVGITSAGCALAALKFGYDWYSLAKPSHASVARDLKLKMKNPGYDARPAILARIRDLFNPPAKKENKH